MSQEDFTPRALALVANGYRIIPLNGKVPNAGKDWQDIVATDATVHAWGRAMPHANIGILTELTPAVDIDIYDAAVAERMEAWIVANVEGAALAPRRVGQAPKRLLLFRADENFRKVDAGVFVDPQGVKHKVEILSKGQQFAAFGIHPDTKQPFRWTSMEDPLDLPFDELPVLTVEDAQRIAEQFRAICEELGWKRKGKSTSVALSRPAQGEVNGLEGHKRKLKTTTEEIRDALNVLDPDTGYDFWREVGMALHHQFDGSDEGLELWDEWSQSSISYSNDEIVEKWPSFSITPDGRAPVTLATVFKYANDAKHQEAEEDFERVLNVVRTCTDQSQLFKDVAKQVAKAITQEFQFDVAAKKMQDRAKELTGVSPRIDTVRKAIFNYRTRAEETGNRTPDWCVDWVYIENGDRFFSLESKQELTEKGFNAKFDRFVISDEDRALGVASPDAHAAQKALNVYTIPTVYSTVYLPGHPRIVEVLGRTRANTYDETSIPESKPVETDEEHEAVRLVQQHFEITFPDKRERTIVMDYLAYNIQFPTEKIAWALLIQGAEGTGKTWILKFMQMMLGPQNVSPLSAAALQEPTNNAWAEGAKMLFIEEIRLHGSNRYEVLDKLKEPVSNEDITIRRMNRDRYTIPNVTNYGAFTNYWDALPVSKNNRRYFVVATQLQSEEDVIAFNERYPDYFTDLFNAIYAHPAALRGWMMARKLSHWFEPKKPAPDTVARAKMADMSEVSEENDVLTTLLEDSTSPLVCDQLLSLDALEDAANSAGEMLPKGRPLLVMLAKAGFHMIGRMSLQEGGRKTRVFTRKPGLFDMGDTDKRVVQVRQLVAGHALTKKPLHLGFDKIEDEDEWN
jgi:hypothetical protein